MGVGVFKQPKQNITFAAFAGGEAAGISCFAYSTVWFNRLGAPVEPLGVEAIAMGPW